VAAPASLQHFDDFGRGQGAILTHQRRAYAVPALQHAKKKQKVRKVSDDDGTQGLQGGI